MKTIKYLMLLLVTAASLGSCVVRERRGGYVEGHYNYNSYGGRHWVPGHYN